MTTKHFTIGLAVLVLAIVAAFRLGAQPDMSGLARYVLVQSEFQTSANNTRLTERTMFKIDTTNGKTWRFVSRVTSVNLETYWDPIDEVQPKK